MGDALNTLSTLTPRNWYLLAAMVANLALVAVVEVWMLVTAIRLFTHRHHPPADR